MKYLALGDSYTIGESVELHLNFPYQLVAKLRAKGKHFELPTIVAQTGWTSDELLAAIEATNLNSPYDLVTLLIGVNNQYRGYDFQIFIKEFTHLLEQAVKFVGGDRNKVLVLSIPDYAYTPFGQKKEAQIITEELNKYNAAIAHITAYCAIQYIDITPISREGLVQPKLVAADALHPSALQYERWVEKIVKSDFWTDFSKG